MFTIPVKIVEVSGGGGDLPLMTWDPDDPYYTGIDPDDYEFTNSYKTIQGSFIKARGNHSVVPDRWYLEIKIDSTTDIGRWGMYGITNSTTNLSDITVGNDSWIVSYESTGSVSYQSGPLVYAVSENGIIFLSEDGINPLTTLVDNDVLMFAGDRSSHTLYIGLNGSWLWGGEEVYDEINEVWNIEWWASASDPETDTLPIFDDLPTSPYALCQTGDDGAGGATPEELTLLTHTDDITYSPPTGFSVVSGDAETTYLHVLQTTNPMPISQPTQHHLMGALGL